MKRQSYRKLLIILLELNAAINLITADGNISPLLFCAFLERQSPNSHLQMNFADRRKKKLRKGLLFHLST